MALHKNNIFEDEAYRGSVIQSLLAGIDPTWYIDLIDILDHVIDTKLKTISQLNGFKDTLYDDTDIEIWELVLPSVRRVFGKVFITPPTILDKERLQLFQLTFNIDKFLDYLIDMFLKTRTALIEFKFLDREAETLTLIVDNYIASLLEEIRNVENIQMEIRDLKIQNLL